MNMLLKRQPYRNQKIRDAARGEDCTVNGPSCNHDPETTVFCHLNEGYAGKGTGQKADDIGFFACANCHFDVDNDHLPDADWYILRAVYRTIRRLIDRGILK